MYAIVHFVIIESKKFHVSSISGKGRPLIKRKCRKYLGCFKDDGRRILPRAFVNMRFNNPRRCSRHCRLNGYKYSGVQYKTQCFCGKEMAERARRLSYRRCNMKCPGNRNRRCGGSWAMNIYQNSGSPCKNIAFTTN